MTGVHYSQSYSSCHLKSRENIHYLYGYKGLLVYNCKTSIRELNIYKSSKFETELHLHMGLTTILLLHG